MVCLGYLHLQRRHDLYHHWQAGWVPTGLLHDHQRLDHLPSRACYHDDHLYLRDEWNQYLQLYLLLTMTDLALKILERYGFPTLVALGLAYLLNEQRADAKADRHDYALTLVQEINEVQASVEKLESTCTGRTKPNGVQ
jgi:hypothetical protein